MSTKTTSTATKPVVAVPLGTSLEEAEAAPVVPPAKTETPAPATSGERFMQIIGSNQLSRRFGRRPLVRESEVRGLGYNPDACVKAGWAAWAREEVKP